MQFHPFRVCKLFARYDDTLKNVKCGNQSNLVKYSYDISKTIRYLYMSLALQVVFPSILIFPNHSCPQLLVNPHSAFILHTIITSFTSYKGNHFGKNFILAVRSRKLLRRKNSIKPLQSEITAKLYKNLTLTTLITTIFFKN